VLGVVVSVLKRHSSFGCEAEIQYSIQKARQNRVSHRRPQQKQEADASEHCKRSAHCKSGDKNRREKKQRKQFSIKGSGAIKKFDG
jgi:hypothetical protein